MKKNTTVAELVKCGTCGYKSADGAEFRTHSCADVLAAQWVCRRANLVEQLTYDLNALNGQLLKFRDEFAQEPLETLKWSDSVFVAAAKQRVTREAMMLFAQFDKEALTPEQQWARVLKYFTEKAMRGARFPKMSTSVPSNLAETYQTQAYAEMAEKLDLGL